MSIIAELLCGSDFFCGDFVGGEMTVNLQVRAQSLNLSLAALLLPDVNF